MDEHYSEAPRPTAPGLPELRRPQWAAKDLRNPGLTLREVGGMTFRGAVFGAVVAAAIGWLAYMDSTGDPAKGRLWLAQFTALGAVLMGLAWGGQGFVYFVLQRNENSRSAANHCQASSEEPVLSRNDELKGQDHAPDSTFRELPPRR